MDAMSMCMLIVVCVGRVRLTPNARARVLPLLASWRLRQSCERRDSSVHREPWQMMAVLSAQDQERQPCRLAKGPALVGEAVYAPRPGSIRQPRTPTRKAKDPCHGSADCRPLLGTRQPDSRQVSATLSRCH